MTSSDLTFFQFEADFVESLRCIPMQVRMKLDICGIKLKLPHWNQFIAPERQRLVEMPCRTEAEIEAYREYLQRLVVDKTGTPAKELAVDPHPAWLNTETVPATTKEKAAEFDVAIAPQQWVALTPLQRFALIKLSRPGHENQNFFSALKEFQLV